MELEFHAGQDAVMEGLANHKKVVLLSVKGSSAEGFEVKDRVFDSRNGLYTDRTRHIPERGLGGLKIRIKN